MAIEKPRPVKPDDDRPRCPGCGRELSGPRVDPLDPPGLVATCANCRQITTFARFEGRWRVIERTMSPPEVV